MNTALWSWWLDESIPSFVKRNYSPKEAWKNRPFSREDAAFFYRGIEELSDLFTHERPSALPDYFSHPRFRSAYFLYFLPLQSAKFMRLFEEYPKALDAMLLSEKDLGCVRIGDLGAGPGTASFALLQWLGQRSATRKSLPAKVEFHWYDQNFKIMDEGKKLALELLEHVPALKERVEIHLHKGDWVKEVKTLPEFSLLLLGNVLNEKVRSSRGAGSGFAQLFDRSRGAGILFVEPAARGPAQLLSWLRAEALEQGWLSDDKHSLWGPCLHLGACPLADGRDWCHSSFKAEIPGKWFKEFSKGLGSERNWLKMSYLWFASRDFEAKQMKPFLRRVVSDPIHLNGTRKRFVQLCEPEQVIRHSLKGEEKLLRGDLVSIKDVKELSLRPRRGPASLKE